MSGKIKIKKEKEPKATSAVFIDVDLIEQLKDIKSETGMPISKLVEMFVTYGIENHEVVEED